VSFLTTIITYERGDIMKQNAFKLKFQAHYIV